MFAWSYGSDISYDDQIFFFVLFFCFLWKYLDSSYSPRAESGYSKHIICCGHIIKPVFQQKKKKKEI